MLEEEKSVSRRQFLKIAGIAGAAIGMGGGLGGLVAACGTGATTTTTAATTATTAGGTGTTAATAATTVTPASTVATSAAGGFGGEVVLGVLNSLTGANAMGGEEQKWAQEQAAADINAKGGISIGGKPMELKLKFMDDKSDSAESAAAMEKLIKVEGVKLAVSSNNSAFTLAAAAIAEKYGAYFQCTNMWVNWISDKNYKWVSVVSTTPDQVAELPFAALDLQPAADRPTRFGILTQDNSDGQALGQSAVAIGKTHGYNMVEYQANAPGAKDFSSIILKYKSSKVDALFGLCAPADALTFMKQVKEQNFSPKFIGGWMGFWPAEFQAGLGPDANNVMHDGFWSENGPNPGSAELGQAFRAAHSGRDSVSIGYPYAGVQIVAAAIGKAQSTDPAAVRDMVFGGAFPGTTMGDIQFSPTGVGMVKYILLQWQDGKRAPIYPAAPGSQLRWFVPWDQR